MIDEIASVGRRADRLRVRRRRRKIAAGVAIAGLLAGGGALWLSVAGTDAPSKAGAVYGTADEGPQITTVVAMQRHDAPNGRADSLTVFAVDRTGDKPVAVFVPTKTLTQVPAFAYTSIGDALIDTPFLQRIALENMTGISMDNIVVLDDVAMGRFIDALGGLDITVDQDVYVLNDQGGKVLEFQHGRQHLDAAQAVTYMLDVGEGQNEIDRFPRQQAVWEAIVSAGRARIHEALGTLDTSDVEPDQRAALQEILTAFAAAPAGARTYETLPSTPVISGGNDESFQLDAAGLDAMASRDFAASELGGSPSARLALEIRNGAGVPGAGERAAALLIEDGYKVAVAANASSFRYAATTITVYGQDAAATALGARLKTLLGRGAVRLAPPGQTVVEATIVIGRDFANP